MYFIRSTTDSYLSHPWSPLWTASNQNFLASTIVQTYFHLNTLKTLAVKSVIVDGPTQVFHTWKGGRRRKRFHSSCHTSCRTCLMIQILLKVKNALLRCFCVATKIECYVSCDCKAKTDKFKKGVKVQWRNQREWDEWQNERRLKGGRLIIHK